MKNPFTSKYIYYCVALLILFFSMNCAIENETDNSDTKLVETIEIKDNWQFRQMQPGSQTGKWYDAAVPGCVHTDLMANELMEDPFYRDNEDKVQWVENEDWEYRTRFTVDRRILQKEKIEFVFKGIDTYARIYLNNKLLLETDNMFREWKVEVKAFFFLKPGENTLLIHFISPLRTAFPSREQLDYKLPGGPKVKTRKPGYHYGWDWGPKLTTSGIFRPVYLKAWDKAKIESLQLVQGELSKQKAQMTAVFNIKATTRQDAQVSILDERTGETLKCVSVDLVPGANRISVSFDITNPKRWWTNGLGEPYLYTLTGELRTGKNLRDRVSHHIGLRTVELVTKKDNRGKSFYFKLNGVPVFIKGANYIPQDNFLPRVTEERYKQLIKDTRNANMNMLRVWGGGFYENDIFYDLCDEAGILVWQDFMFACAMYPGDKDFLENVRQEAVDNVKRLRNHPCIALWCGNNEIDEAWHNWGWQSTFTEIERKEIWRGYEKLFHELLPGVVKEYDSGRFYWPSSPKFGRGDKRSLTQGDSHYWGVWHDAEPFDVLKEKTGRFMSEFGFQAFPPIDTVKGFALPEDFELESNVMKVHQKHPRGNLLIKTYMERDYHIPDHFEDFLYVSAVLQAEGIKMGIEAQRRAKPFCMGTLYWQLNDCWPAVSWSSIDWTGNWKALHYYVKKAYKDLLVSPVEKEGILKVFIVSDRPKPLEGPLLMQLMELSGKVLWEERKKASVKANSSESLFEEDVERLLKSYDKRNVVFRASFLQGDEVLSSNHYYFVPPKDLRLTKPKITPRVISMEKGAVIELSCETLAKNVYLRFEGAKGFFSDNYFDLLPGEKVKVDYITHDKVENLSKKLKIISLFDTQKEN